MADKTKKVKLNNKTVNSSMSTHEATQATHPYDSNGNNKGEKDGDYLTFLHTRG